MATNNDQKNLNAYRLHLVLLNVANEAARFKMTEIIQTRNPSVKEFLIEKYNANRRNTPDYLKGFIQTLNEKYRGITTSFPNHLKDFDISACSTLSRSFLQFPDDVEREIKQRDPNNRNCVKDFLAANFDPNIQNQKDSLYGFVQSLRNNYDDPILFPNDLTNLTVFDSSVCYAISKYLLDKRNYFDDLKDIRNKWYGHLNRLEIEDANYDVVMNRLKQIINDFTQNAPDYQKELHDKIKQIESFRKNQEYYLSKPFNFKI